MNPVQPLLRAFDRFQQRHPVLAFPIAVVKKFGDDQAGYLAALIAYYGFFSLFPLLLVFVSVLGFVFQGHPSLREAILDSALRNFPVIGPQLTRDVSALRSGLALGVGVAGTLWAGLGVTQAAQNAMNTVWNVPKRDRPNFLVSRARGLVVLAILGSITVAATFASGFGASGGSATTVAWLLRVLGIAASLALNLVLFLLAFRVLTVRRLRWGDVLPGAVVAAVVWTALQSLGGFYVTHQVRGAGEVYGTFALVIGLLVWLYLGAQVTLYCAEINVVRTDRLWPRSLLAEPPPEPGRRLTLPEADGIVQRGP